MRPPPWLSLLLLCEVATANSAIDFLLPELQQEELTDDEAYFETGHSCKWIMNKLKEVSTTNSCHKIFRDQQHHHTQQYQDSLFEQCYYCRQRSNCEIFDSYSQNNPYALPKSIFSQLSALSLAIVGLFMLTHSKLRVHPYSIIAISCIAQGTYFATVYAELYICPDKMPAIVYMVMQLPNSLINYKTTDWSRFFSDVKHTEDKYQIYRMLVRNWRTITILSIFIALGTMSIVFFDLYLTLKNPFYPREKRKPYYYTYMFILMVGSVIIVLESINEFEVSIGLKKKLNFIDLRYYVVVFSLPLLANIVTVCLSTRMLSRKGTSNNLKKKVRSRQIASFFVYLVTFVGFIVNEIDFGIQVGLSDYTPQQKKAADMADAIFSISGVLLALMRLWEPFVYQEFKNSLKNCCGCCCRSRRRRRQKYSNEPLCAFTNSAFNIEFVYLIILGINNFMDNSELTSGRPLKKQKTRMKISKDKEETRITMCDLKVNNIDKWNVRSDSISEMQSVIENFRNRSVAYSHYSRKNSELPFVINRNLATSPGQSPSANAQKPMPSPSINYQGTDEDDEVDFYQTLQDQVIMEVVEEDELSSTHPMNKKLASSAVHRQETNDFYWDTQMGNQVRRQTTGLQNNLKNNLAQVDINKKGIVSYKFKSELLPKNPEGRSSTQEKEKNLQESIIALKAEFVSYHENKFQEIMTMDGISPADLKKSLSIEENRRMIFNAGEGAGRSGSFFFFSYDNRFLIKTLLGPEKKIFLSILDDYIEHLKKTKNQSLIARIYGVFTIKTNVFAPLDVVIMQNTSRLHNKDSSVLKFDMKGSTIKRSTKLRGDEQKFWKKNLHCKKILKDMNYLEINKDCQNQLFKVPEHQFDNLAWIIKEDSLFLKNKGIMDYSLLLVIEHVKIKQNIDWLGKGSQMSNANKESVNSQDYSFHFSREESDKTSRTESQDSSLPEGMIWQQNAKTRNVVKGGFGKMQLSKDSTLYKMLSSKTMRSSRASRNSSGEDNLSIATKSDRSSSHSRSSNSAHSSSRSSAMSTSLAGGAGKMMKKKTRSRGLSDEQKQVKSRLSADFEYVYHLGIIDFLQKWDLSKKSERFFKSFMKDKRVKNEISAVPPGPYQKRFQDFVTQKVLWTGLEAHEGYGNVEQAEEAFISEISQSLEAKQQQLKKTK